MPRLEHGVAKAGVRGVQWPQIEYSLMHRVPESNGLLDLCKELNITVIAYSPLAQGMLSGKYGPDNLPTGVRRRRYGKKLVGIQPLVTLLGELGQKYDKSAAQVAINWTVCKGTVPIPGARNARQAQENLGAIGWRLDASDILSLDEASAELS